VRVLAPAPLAALASDILLPLASDILLPLASDILAYHYPSASVLLKDTLSFRAERQRMLVMALRSCTLFMCTSDVLVVCFPERSMARVQGEGSRESPRLQGWRE